MAYADMDDTTLIDAYNKAQADYYTMYNKPVQFGNMMVNNAQQFVNNNIDITRDFLKWEDYNVKLDNDKDLKYAQEKWPDKNYKMGDTVPSKKQSNVYLPYVGIDMDRKSFSRMMQALKSGDQFEYDGVTYDSDKINNKFLGPSETWGYDENSGRFRMSTTDNTCAAFTCAVLDYTDAQLKTDDALNNIVFNDHKNREWSKDLSASEWEDILQNLAISDEEYQDGKRTYLNTKTYMASPYKISRAAANNPDTWSTYDQSDFQKGLKPGDDGYLDPRSEEYWKKYVKPGDLIIYYDPKRSGNDTTHIAIAGNNPNEIYHDGSDVNNVKQNSKNQAHHRRSKTKPNEHFRIIRYTNQTQLTNAKNNLDQIELALQNRDLSGANEYAMNDNGTYDIVPQIDTTPVQTVVATNDVENTEEPEDMEVTVDATNQINPNDPFTNTTNVPEPEKTVVDPFTNVQQAGPTGIFTNLYNKTKKKSKKTDNDQNKPG